MEKKKVCEFCVDPMPPKADFRFTAERFPITLEEEILLRKIHSKRIEQQLINYRPILVKKHKRDLDKIYDPVEVMLDELLYSQCFRYGLKLAIKYHYPKFKADDRDNFMLIQFLEEAKECVAVEETTDEPEEDWFDYALFMALQVSDNPNFLARLYRYKYEKSL